MELSFVGMGMGGPDDVSVAAAKALQAADVIVGAPRLVEGLAPDLGAEKIAEALPKKVAKVVRAQPKNARVCVALSGDVGFYSGAAKLGALLGDLHPRYLCGTSSPQALAAKLGRPWQNFKLVSAHGRAAAAVAEVLNHPAVFFLTGGACSAAGICDVLAAAGLGGATVTVGENLGAENERIVAGTAEELAQEAFAALSVMLVENDRTFARGVVSPGIPDDDFVRGGTPMTKREVRVNALSLLEIRPDDILYDVGAGTGSVAVEMALLARRGQVFAVEREEDACDLIAQNKEKFGAWNLHVMPGEAPDMLEELPPPNAAFIGGSHGQMRPILEVLLAKNPNVRLVAAAVTLQTLHAAVQGMEELGVADVQVVQVAAARTGVVSGLHMLQAQNPVFLVSGVGCVAEGDTDVK